MSKKSVANRKKLIIIAFFMIVLLIILIIILGKTRGMDKGYRNDAKMSEFSSNSEKLIDYHQCVMEYGNDVFILDELSNAIIKYNASNGTNMAVVNFRNHNYGKHFFIRSNQLIYSYDDDTFYSDLNGNHEKKLTNGEVVYIDDNVYVFISHKTTRDELYIVSYDNKTFRTTNALSHQIANGKNIKYVKEEGKNLYFSSVSESGYLSILEVDLEQSLSRLITRMSEDSGYANMTLDISDILKEGEDYYYVINEVSFTTNEEHLINYSYLYRSNIEENYEEILADDVGLYLARHPKNKDMILYEQYTESGEAIWQNMELEETSYKWQDLVYGDVTERFYLEDTGIYQGEEKWLELNMDMSEYALMKVVRLDNDYYILMDNVYQHTWYRCNEDGTNLTKITADFL